MSARLWLDRSPHLMLACCGCGWREVAVSTPRGWALLADHVLAVHGDPEARQYSQIQASKSRNRAGRNG